MCFVRIGTSYGRRKCYSTPTQQDLGNSLGLFSKFLTGTAILFVWESRAPDIDELEYFGPWSSEGML